MTREREPGARRYRRFWGPDFVRDADDELAFHVAMRVDEFRRAGMSEAEAQQAAMQRLGDVQGVRTEVHDIAHQRTARRRRAWRLDALRGDVRFAIRMLLANPGYAAALVLTLALGIGANAAVFSVAYGVLLRPLPYHAADRIVRIYSNSPKRNLPVFSVSPADFGDWLTQSKSFSTMAAFERQRDATLQSTDAPQTVGVSAVTTNVFTLLGVVAERGRALMQEDATPQSPAVVVISHELWEARFGRDPNILQHDLVLDGKRYAVVGIMPPRFLVPGTSAQLWIPLSFANAPNERGNRYLRVLGRLAPGATLTQAQRELDVIADRIAKSYPRDADGWGTALVPVRDLIIGTQFERALLTLVGVVAFVLLIACANAANLQLARAAARQRELAVRAALGASRRRIAGQLLTEGIVVSIVAGAVGVALAYGGVSLLRALGGATVPRLDDVRLDAPVLAFAAVVALASGIVVGLIPVARSSTNLVGGLMATARGAGRPAIAARIGGALVVAEISLSLVLLVGAGLLLKSFARLQAVDIGFDDEGRWVVPVRFPEALYPDVHVAWTTIESVIARASAVPGIDAVAAIDTPPFSGPNAGLAFLPAGQPLPVDTRPPDADYRTITSGYFRTAGIRLLRGRDITPEDREGAPLVGVISLSMAKRYWPDADPVGRQIRIGDLVNGPLITIVGLVADVRYQSLEGDEIRPMLYLSAYARPTRSMALVARVSIDAASASLKSIVASVDHRLPPPTVARLRDLVAMAMATRRFALTMFGVFAAVAVTLAVIGLFGVLSYLVRQRTHELGIRIALGAPRSQLLGMVVGGALRLATAGVVVGVGASLALTGLLGSLLFGVTPTDTSTFVVLPILLVLVAVGASIVPAVRAVRVDPINALRGEA